jgi:hypothetical protein
MEEFAEFLIFLAVVGMAGAVLFGLYSSLEMFHARLCLDMIDSRIVFDGCEKYADKLWRVPLE